MSQRRPTDVPGPLAELITFRLSRLQARANAQAARTLKAQANLSLSEWRMLVVIETSGAISPARIVDLTGFDKALVSRSIKRLQTRGLVNVALKKTDGRSHIVSFTSKGREVLERARPAMRARQEILRAGLGPGELETLFVLLDKLDAALDTLDEQS